MEFEEDHISHGTSEDIVVDDCCDYSPMYTPKVNYTFEEPPKNQSSSFTNANQNLKRRATRVMRVEYMNTSQDWTSTSKIQNQKYLALTMSKRHFDAYLQKKYGDKSIKAKKTIEENENINRIANKKINIKAFKSRHKPNKTMVEN